MPKRVLYVEGNIDGTVGGSYFLMYDLVCALDTKVYLPIVGFHRDNYLVERLRSKGVEVVLFPQPRSFEFGWRPLNSVLAPIKKLVNFCRNFLSPALSHARFLRERKIDLVNLNNSITRNHSWMLAAMLTRTPCITHEMGISATYSGISRFFGKRLKGIICLSYAIRDAMKRCGISYANISVIHCGIDLRRYQLVETPEELRVKHGIPASARIIGVVGNIRPWKGQETIVRATAVLVREFPGIRCVLAGDSTEADRSYRLHLESLCRDAGIVDNVVFAGFQRNAIDYMRLMDVVVHTSVHPEPFGIVTLEAMSLAKPLVSTSIGGPAEVVVDGVTGLLVEPGQPELLARAISKMLNDPEAAGQMGLRGKERLASHFSLGKNLNETMAVYAKILAA